MHARKVYRFLIVIFLVLTVVFSCLYRKESAGKSYLSDDFVKDATKNIENKGVSLSADIIEKSIPEKNIYTFEIENISDYEKKVTDSVVSQIFGKNAKTASFDTPEGVSVGIYLDGDDSKESGRIVFKSSDLTFSYTKSGVGIDGAFTRVSNGLDEDVAAKHKKAIDSFVNKLSPDSCVTSYRISGCSSNDEYSVVTAVQTIDGYDLYDVYMNFVFMGDETVGIYGTWITKTPKAKYYNKLVDGVNVLYKLDFSQIREITGEKLVYFLRRGDNNKFFVIPGWEISYTDKGGKNKTAQFDAL